MIRSIPLNASASNTLVISLPLATDGSATALGICKKINHRNIIKADKRAICLSQIFKNTATPDPINAIPAK